MDPGPDAARSADRTVGAPPSLRSRLWEIRGWTYPTVNKHFTHVAFALPPIGGSAVSFLYNGGALWCLLEVLRGRYHLSREPHVLAMTAALYAYCAVMIVSAFINPNLDQSLLRLPTLGALLLFPFSYAIWRVSDKATIMRACIVGSAVACIGGLLIAAIQVHFFDMRRASGGAGNALVFANVVAVAGGVALAGAFKYKGRERALCILAYAASALAVVYSASRGPLIVVVANAILVSSLYARARSFKAIFGSALAAILLLFLLIQLDVTQLDRRLLVILSNFTDMTEHGDFASSIGVRVALWEIGIDLFWQKPLLGHGAGNLQELIRTNLTVQYDMSRGYTHFHNVFLNTLVEGGLAAVATLIAMIAVPLTVAFRVLSAPAQETEHFGAMLLLLILTMFVITGLTNLVLRHDIMDSVFLIFTVVGLFLAAGRPVPSIAAREPDSAAQPSSGR